MTPEEILYQKEWRANNREKMNKYRRKYYHRTHPNANKREHLYTDSVARKYVKDDRALGGLFEGCTPEQIAWMTKGLNDKFEQED